MNYRSILLLASLIVNCSSCKKTADSVSDKSDESSKSVSLQEFKTQNFVTFDGSKTISIISQDELELSKNNDIFVCKYTSQDGKIRVIFNVLGTTQALYFQLTTDGLKGGDVEIYYSPQKLKSVREIASEDAARKKALEDVSRTPTKEIITILTVGSDSYAGKKLKVTLWDTQFTAQYNEGKPEKVWYGDVREISPRYMFDYDTPELHLSLAAGEANLRSLPMMDKQTALKLASEMNQAVAGVEKIC